MILIKFYYNDNKGIFLEYAEDRAELNEFLECNKHIISKYEILEEE